MKIKMWTYVSWPGIALLAPEYVLWRAIHQWETARQLRDEVNKILDKRRREQPERTERPQPATPPQFHDVRDDSTAPLLASAAAERPFPLHPPSTWQELPADRSIPQNLEKDDALPWEIEHGYYAVMGGFTVSVPKQDQ